MPARSHHRLHSQGQRPTGSNDAAMRLLIAAVLSLAQYLQQETSAHRFSGDVLVAVNDRVIFQRAYGYANVELRVPNTLRTRFRIFSITKQFTAAALMSLVQSGKLDVDAPLAQYLHNFPNAWRNATVAQALNHSSGLPQLEGVWGQAFLNDAAQRSQCGNYNAALPKLAASGALTDAPGTRWRYNNFAYDLLGCVIERASGMPLANYLQTAIFTPAGMANSGLAGRSAAPEPMYDGPLVVDGMATGYNGSLGVIGNLQQAMAEQYASAAAGDMYSTVGDLWRYSEALYAGKLLTPQTQARMVSESIPVNATARWGLGWAVTTINGHTFMHHSGGNNGYSAEFARFPDERATIVVLSNFGFIDASAVRAHIAELAFHGKYATPK